MQGPSVAMAAAAVVVIRAQQQKKALMPGGARMNTNGGTDSRRLEASWDEYQRRVKVNRTIKKYDSDNSGTLNREQLIKLLTDTDFSTPKGTRPTDEEVDWIMKVADKSGDQRIDNTELQEAMACWATFVAHRKELEEKLEKYDLSGDGRLERDEVKKYLTDLNGGQPVSDEEVEMVIRGAGVMGNGYINKMELQAATALWYGHVERRKSCCSIL